jgi:hypothetical protein
VEESEPLQIPDLRVSRHGREYTPVAGSRLQRPKGFDNSAVSLSR